MARKYYYVSPKAIAGWKLTSEGRVLFENPRKADVEARGRATARANAPSELVIQNSDGEIAERETYGDDPFPPQG